MHLRNSWFLVDIHPGSACARCRRLASGGRGLNFLMLFLTSKFQETSVTRSRMRGKARIGSTFTGWPSGSEFMRVMHMSFGMPLISAEHDPHLPALQFQRTARSFACSA